ncbi:MAG: M23 family metallopeptidase [Spirochaetales bacterium]|nr:M23 family metallopeptidase [Spirochaetales bacterium]
MKFRRLVILLLFTLAGLGYAFDWPLKNHNILATFGQNMGDRCLQGLLLMGGNQDVFPVAEGEVIFYYENKSQYSSVPRGLGSFVALQHEGDVQSIYGHLKPGSVTSSKTLGTNDILGKTGDSGATPGESLYISFINIEENEILNPIKHLIPFFIDTKTPVVEDILIKTDNTFTTLGNKQTFKPGETNLYVSAYDLREDIDRVWKLCPYKISVARNGQEIYSFTFDAFSENSGRLALSRSNLAFGNIFADEWIFRLGDIELYKGRNHIQVFVQDFSGHLASKETFINAE